MKIINPSYEILTKINGKEILQEIERAGRTCYKSEDKITEESCQRFVDTLIRRGHHAMIEHGPSISVRFICNRGFTHELVRSRLCSYAQESTRNCNYSMGKYGGEITFIKPAWFMECSNVFKIWEDSMRRAESDYLMLLKYKCSPQEARGVLPIDVKTEIVCKANIREWRHIFKIRTHSAAHPSMHQLMRPLCDELTEKIPVVFDDIGWK